MGQAALAGAARQIEQDGIVDALPAHEHAHIPAIDRNHAQFSDAAGHRLAFGIEDGRGAGGAEERECKNNHAQDTEPQPEPARPAAGYSGQLSGEAHADARTDDHRQQPHQSVKAAAQDEGEDAVGFVQAQHVYRRADRAAPCEFDRDNVSHWSQQKRPVRIHCQSGDEANRQAGKHDEERLRGGGRAVWHSPGGEPPDHCSKTRPDCRTRPARLPESRRFD